LVREDAVGEREKGFSLVELMVAMTVTLIVTGAVFQLMTAGQTAFRREPAMADRQQNIRAGLDLISQDLYGAGSGVPPFAQAFTQGLNESGPMGSGGVNTDQLEFIRSSDCDALTVCKIGGTNLFTIEPLPSSCLRFPATIIAGCTDTAIGGPNCPTYDVYWALERGSGTDTDCKAGHINMPAGKSDLNPPGGKRNFEPQWVITGSIVRYRINPDADGIPNLERSELGGALDTSNNSSWQIVARGVEDLQVEYENATGPGGSLRWLDDPGATSTANTLIRRVRVQLSARVTEGGPLAGETTAADGTTAVRGQLGVEIAPRTANATLAAERGEM
jgi:type IV pilus assembly protein PilW